MIDYCNVVLDNDCRAAPDDRGTRAKCFACGLPVCTSCSTLRKYLGYGRQRICANCETQVFPDGEARLLRQAYHRAGYPHVTLANARGMLVHG